MPEPNWLVHASREPGGILLAEMNAWWRETAIATDPGPGICVWQSGPLHTLVHLHVDRAAHKRRRRTLYVSRQACPTGDGSHGITAMTTLVPEDPYGPEPLMVEHSAPGSALDHAYERVSQDPLLLAVTLMTEDEFTDPETYHLHASKRMRPLTSGVVLPVLLVPWTEDSDANLQAAESREELLRAHGFSLYTVDIDVTADDVEQHRTLAMVLEDVCDEITGIKADAAARVLLSDPRWPMLVVRSAPTWEYERSEA